MTTATRQHATCTPTVAYDVTTDDGVWVECAEHGWAELLGWHPTPAACADVARRHVEETSLTTWYFWPSESPLLRRLRAGIAWFKRVVLRRDPWAGWTMLGFIDGDEVVDETEPW